MYKTLKTLLIIATFTLLTACGGSSLLMKPSATQTISPASANKAKIVFMRTSFVAGAINAEIFEIVGGEPKFVGSLPTGNKIVYEVSPGKKIFMAHGTAADFLEANIVSGKTYYVIVRPNWGTGGFAPTPIRTDGTTEYNTNSPDFKDWVKDTELVEMDEAEAAKWFEAEKAGILEAYATYWKRYQEKTPNERAQRTLNPQDGT